MKLRILRKDFDNAVKQEWSAQTCIVQQALKRLGLGNLYKGDVQLFIGETDSEHRKLKDLMVNFDKAFTEPEDKDKDDAQRLRNQLPITIEIKEAL